MPLKIDLLNQRFNSLLVIDTASSSGRGARWLCRCDCGSTNVISTYDLRSGHSKSCGCRCQLSSVPNDTTLVKSLWGTYKSLARKRKYGFELSLETFVSLTKQDCHYCGKPPSQVLKARRKHYVPYIYNGVDRIDNAIGYTETNCVACCGMCNTMKSDFVLDEFLKQCESILKHTNSKRQAEMTCPAQVSV